MPMLWSFWRRLRSVGRMTMLQSLLCTCSLPATNYLPSGLGAAFPTGSSSLFLTNGLNDIQFLLQATTVARSKTENRTNLFK
ncbi:hypothetical protein F5I97DRAFT_1837159 [Phlebopus sp. FC_14]|nr:hypothetical protein F5I97DRAFT_1837159 [Phlebopus sp. FC_14]